MTPEAIETNKALVLDFYRLMNERRFQEMWELFAPDGLWGGGRADTDDFAPIERIKAVIVDPMPIFVDGGIHFTVHSLTAEARPGCRGGGELRAARERQGLQQPLPHALRDPRRQDRGREGVRRHCARARGLRCARTSAELPPPTRPGS